MSIAGLRSSCRSSVRPLLRPPFAGMREFEDGIHYDATVRPDAGGFMSVKAVGGGAVVGTLTDFFTVARASSASFLRSDGLLQTVGNNLRRIEYDVSGGILGLLVEGSRTNLCLQSQDLSTTWTNDGSTETLNVTAAPDGTTSADKMVEDSAVGVTHGMGQNVTFANATAYTFSAFVKPSGRSWCVLQLPATAFTAATFAYFNLSGAGSVGSTSGSPSRTSIQVYPNGWYRVSISKTSTAAAAGNCFIWAATGDGGAAYTGDGASGLFLWGAQIEDGAFPSSYIATLAAPVTRSSDIILRVDSPQVVNTAIGTIYAEVFQSQITAGNQYAVFGKDAVGAAGNPLFRVTSAWNTSDGTNTPARGGIAAAGLMKAAAAWDSGGMAVTHSGLSVSTSAFDGSMLDNGTQISIGSRTTGGGDPLFGHIRRLDYWPQRRSDAFLQAITA